MRAEREVRSNLGLMARRRRPWIALVLLGALACQGKTGVDMRDQADDDDDDDGGGFGTAEGNITTATTGGGYGGTNTLSPTDAGYTVFEGWHDIDYSANTAAGEALPDYYDCMLFWWTSGTPVDVCSDCEFAFDLTLTFDQWEYSYDTGEFDWCQTDGHDRSMTVAFYEDFEGYGPYLTYLYAGSFYPLAAASLANGRLNYSFGYTDQQVGSVYYTYWRKGAADLE